MDFNIFVSKFLDADFFLLLCTVIELVERFVLIATTGKKC
jgi:hypothetical protein